MRLPCGASQARANTCLISRALASGYEKRDTETVASAMLAERCCCAASLARTRHAVLPADAGIGRSRCVVSPTRSQSFQIERVPLGAAVVPAFEERVRVWDVGASSAAGLCDCLVTRCSYGRAPVGDEAAIAPGVWDCLIGHPGCADRSRRTAGDQASSRTWQGGVWRVRMRV